MGKLTKEELGQWRQHPTTKKVFEKIKKNGDFYSTQVVDGTTLHVDDKIPGGTPWTVGVIYGMSQIFNVEHDEEEA